MGVQLVRAPPVAVRRGSVRAERCAQSFVGASLRPWLRVSERVFDQESESTYSLKRHEKPRPRRKLPRPREDTVTRPARLDTDAPDFERLRNVERPRRLRLRNVRPLEPRRQPPRVGEQKRGSCVLPSGRGYRSRHSHKLGDACHGSMCRGKSLVRRTFTSTRGFVGARARTQPGRLAAPLSRAHGQDPPI